MTTLPRDYPICPLSDQGCTLTYPHRHTDGPLHVAYPSSAAAGGYVCKKADRADRAEPDPAFDPEDGAAEYVAREHRVMHVDHTSRIVCLCGQTFSYVGMQGSSPAEAYGKHLIAERQSYVERQGL